MVGLAAGPSRPLVSRVLGSEPARGERPPEAMSMPRHGEASHSDMSDSKEARNDPAIAMPNFKVTCNSKSERGYQYPGFDRAECIVGALEQSSCLRTSAIRLLHRGCELTRIETPLDFQVRQRLTARKEIRPSCFIVLEVRERYSRRGRNEVWPAGELRGEPVIEDEVADPPPAPWV